VPARDMPSVGPGRWTCPSLARAGPGHALRWPRPLDMSLVGVCQPGTCPPSALNWSPKVGLVGKSLGCEGLGPVLHRAQAVKLC
jgi:hypothetical protein